MQKIKGATSRVLREEFIELKKMPSLWKIKRQDIKEKGVNIISNYILTLKLNTQIYLEDVLDKRLEISRGIYNSCLGELYKRYNHMRQSKEYRKVVEMVKGKERNKQFNELNKKYSLTEYSLHTFVKSIQKHFKDNIDSFTTQKIATRCFAAFQKLMLHKSNRVYFKKYGEMNSIEGKSNGTGIRFIDNKLVWNGLVIGANVKKSDEYAQISLLNKIKFCRIVRKFIRGKYKYYIQLILEGVPPLKYNKDNGEVKNGIGKGDVGIDIGTQNELRDIQRKQADIRKQSHEKLANYVLSLGNVVKVEVMNYRGLQKRSKETTINDKTGKFNRKKRFGKSLANKAPSMFLTILDNKLKWNNEILYKINTYKVKASQYNHFDSECNKKELSERWNYFNFNNEEVKIQRDLYSSFLIMNVKDNLEEIDRELCFRTYDNFKHLHDKEINRLLSSNNKIISSMGI